MRGMIGVLVNTAAVLLGSGIGLIFKKGIPQRIVSAVMIGIGFCTLYIGVAGSLKGENALIAVASMVLGAVVGTLGGTEKDQRWRKGSSRPVCCSVSAP
jgi:uncharacterized protein